ncbi:protein-disulfide reductase DsbD family protein [Estrella lausannensis]|uniref:protein-disulfide reductase DsbD family protein n=1 Tax=Estrella lausannensis TaxID=483423 RepID=UPI0013040A2F|nr:protein-disulfide reductase DsbD domain-containing protein [Estrella lausannensis]
MAKRTLFLLFALFCFIGAESQIFAHEQEMPGQTQQETLEEDEPLTVSCVADSHSITAGNPFYVAIVLDHQDGWHSYWKNPGEVGIPTSVEWQLPEGFTVSELKWPVPSSFSEGGIVGFGYEGKTYLLAEITPPSALEIAHYPIKATVSWLACSNDACLPGSKEIEIKLSKAEGNALASAHKETIEKAKSALPESGLAVVSEQQSDETIELLLAPPQGLELTQVQFLSAAADPTGQFSPCVAEVTREGYIRVSLKKQPADPEGQAKVEGLLVTGDSKVASAYEISHHLKHPSPVYEQDQLIALNDEAGKPVINPTSPPTPLEEEGEGSVLLFLAMAFLGGAILNLMPCVLPVVSLKILNFMQVAGQSRTVALKHGFAYSLGVLVSFWALAAALLVLQAYGNAVGWGFQLQEPLFVAILAAVLFVFSLSMFGVVEFGTILQAIAGKKEVQSKKESKGLTGSFLSGVLATAVATPCTGPFLGPAIGFAVTQSPFISLLMFTSLGLGMALPYLLLSGFPSLLRFLPKPGNWMIAFKEGVAFIMIATVLWLLWVFGAETEPMSLFLLMGALLLFAIACWIWGRFGTPVKSKRVRLIGALFALTLSFIGGKLLVDASMATPPEEFAVLENSNSAAALHRNGDWEPFSRERLNALIKEGKPVIIDFTARWCLICQTNHMVLATSGVEAKFKELGVVKMKADWTRRDPEITKELRLFGRSGVPLYLYYDGKQAEPKILPQILTPEIVISAMEESN